MALVFILVLCWYWYDNSLGAVLVMQQGARRRRIARFRYNPAKECGKLFKSQHGTEEDG
jgi:hypothetical protein